MNRFQQMFVAREVLDGGWRSDHRGAHRVMSVDELDAIAGFTWRWRAPLRAVAARVDALRARWRSGPRAQGGRVMGDGVIG